MEKTYFVIDRHIDVGSLNEELAANNNLGVPKLTNKLYPASFLNRTCHDVYCLEPETINPEKITVNHTSKTSVNYNGDLSEVFFPKTFIYGYFISGCAPKAYSGVDIAPNVYSIHPSEIANSKDPRYEIYKNHSLFKAPPQPNSRKCIKKTLKETPIELHIDGDGFTRDAFSDIITDLGENNTDAELLKEFKSPFYDGKFNEPAYGATMWDMKNIFNFDIRNLFIGELFKDIDHLEKPSIKAGEDVSRWLIKEYLKKTLPTKAYIIPFISRYGSDTPEEAKNRTKAISDILDSTSGIKEVIIVQDDIKGDLSKRLSSFDYYRDLISKEKSIVISSSHCGATYLMDPLIKPIDTQLSDTQQF